MLGPDKCGSDVQEHEVIMDKDVLPSQAGGKKDGKWGEEIQQSLTDKAQCTTSLNSLCSDKVRVKKGKKSKTEEAFLKSYRGLREK